MSYFCIDYNNSKNKRSPREGLLPEGKGLLPEGKGLLPEGKGLLPEGKGLLPEGKGLLPEGKGLLPEGKGLSTKQEVAVKQGFTSWDTSGCDRSADVSQEVNRSLPWLRASATEKYFRVPSWRVGIRARKNVPETDNLIIGIRVGCWKIRYYFLYYLT